MENKAARAGINSSPAQSVPFACATGSLKASNRRTRRQEIERIFTIEKAGDKTFNIHLLGRDRWALERLIEAGEQGCTPIDTPAPRWSAYIFNLRQLGVDVETITETHSGEFPGHHARYRLNCVARKVGGA